MKKTVLSPTRTIILLSIITSLFIMVLTFCSREAQKGDSLTDLQMRALSFTTPMPDHAFTEDMEWCDNLVELGKMLFYEPRLSKSGLISCNTCHNMATFGVDQLPVSLGHAWQEGPINSPTVLNAAFHKTQFWDGRAAHVEEQAGMPVLDPLEMASTEEHVLAVLTSIPEYVHRFHHAFPDQQNPVVYENVGVAIGAFERTLITRSPFDNFLRGNDEALTGEQKKGLDVFMEVGCQTCHRGQVLGGDLFMFFQTPQERKTGIAHPGRFNFTKREADKHFFKVPSLLNIAHTYPYLHDGSIWELSEAVEVVAREMLMRELTPEQNQLLVTFLNSLTGEIPEYALKLPVLPASTSTTPRPVFGL
jgi:cytochrome c peroxidase